MTGFPQDFTLSTEQLLGKSEATALFNALDKESSTSIRYNPFKVSQKPEGTGVPWCRYGFMLDKRPSFTLDPVFHSGVYYVQESSSMFLEHVMRQATGNPEGLTVLDLCAAPGGKTTLLSTIVGLTGVVVANEVIRSRANILAENVRKWGLGNVIVTNNDPAHFASLEGQFDVIVIDAPCSGEGMFRKDHDARMQWSASNVELCAARQRRIVADAWSSLAEGGLLIYSTCTFNEQENEQNVKWITENYNCEGVNIDVDPAWGVVKGETEGIETFRFFPHKVAGEGLFMALMRKTSRVKPKRIAPRKTPFGDVNKADRIALSRWIGTAQESYFSLIGDNIYCYNRATFPIVKRIAESMNAIYSGVMMGRIFNGKLRPEHSLALYHDLAATDIPKVDVSIEDALKYLRRQDLDLNMLSEGLNLICFNNHPLGWIKRIGHRANNAYPMEMKINN